MTSKIKMYSSLKGIKTYILISQYDEIENIRNEIMLKYVGI